MQDVTSLVGIALALSIGAASPGPSFVMIARTAASSRLNGLYAALGMGCGGLIFAILSLLGLNGLFIAVPKLYFALKVVGGLYLTYLGLKIWRAAKELPSQSFELADDKFSSPFSNFALGATTQLSNPKTAIVYASVFAAFMPSSQTLLFDLCIVLIVLIIESGWYSFVAFALSSNKPRMIYLRFKKFLDKVAGGVMILLGLRLAASSAQ